MFHQVSSSGLLPSGAHPLSYRAFEQELLALQEAGRYAEFLRLAVQNHQTIVVSGKTGSGKTTFMKGPEEVSHAERLITIQDRAELTLPHPPNVAHLYYSKDAQGAAKVSHLTFQA